MAGKHFFLLVWPSCPKPCSPLFNTVSNLLHIIIQTFDSIQPQSPAVQSVVNKIQRRPSTNEPAVRVERLGWFLRRNLFVPPASPTGVTTALPQIILVSLFATGSTAFVLHLWMKWQCIRNSFVRMFHRPGHLMNSEKSCLRADNCRPRFFPVPIYSNPYSTALHNARSFIAMPCHVGICPQWITFYREISAGGNSRNARTYQKAMRWVGLRWSVAYSS